MDIVKLLRDDQDRDLKHDAADEIERLRAALRTFVVQWNACGPNSDFGRYFANVRQQAVAALGEEK